MKKIMSTAALVMGLGASASVLAAAGPFQTSVQVTPTDCTLLSGNVTLTASNNVHGHYTCDETNSVIKVGTCHTGGGRTQGVVCAYTVDSNSDGVADSVPNSAGCDDAAVAAGSRSTIPNYAAFTATSSGGKLTEQELTGRCDASSLTSLSFWD